jgi:uncharacterized protein YbjT (DUF2867 family)
MIRLSPLEPEDKDARNMKVLIFGATGMVGQGVLRECLAASDVVSVTTIGRTPVDTQHAKLQQIVHDDLFDLQAVEPRLQGFDACFFCLGVSSGGLSEAAYTRLTYDLTMAAASTLARINPNCVFTYVTGAGADSSGNGRVMWARVKGKTENDLRKLPFRGVYFFRPGVIQPLHGIKSKTASYRLAYVVLNPLLPLAKRLFPDTILTTEDVGRAMLQVARNGAGRAILEAGDIARLARQAPPGHI